MVQFAQSHLDFRIPELESVSKALNLSFEQVSEYRAESPFLVIKLLPGREPVGSCSNALLNVEKNFEKTLPLNGPPSSFDLKELAKGLANRCILVKSINELILSATCPSSQLPELVQKDPYYPEFASRVKGRSFKFQYSSFGTSSASGFDDQISLFGKFAFLPTGPVLLDESRVEVKFQIFEDFSHPQEPTSYFGIFIADGARDMISKYNVKKRPYIGTTSMDAELSLIMANMGCIKLNKTLGNDPFAGTGSLLLAMSAMGAYTVGSEIDPRQLRGGAAFDKSKRPHWDRTLQCHTTKAVSDWWSNVIHYGLEGRVLDCIVGDVANQFFSRGKLFDCIVTDPPYGIRAGARKTLDKQLGFGGQLHFDSIIGALLNYAAMTLKLGGRLVFWFPVIPEDEIPNPAHPSFTLRYCSTQECGKWARRLLTMEKTDEYCHLQEPLERTNDFRAKYFASPSN